MATLKINRLDIDLITTTVSSSNLFCRKRKRYQTNHTNNCNHFKLDQSVSSRDIQNFSSSNQKPKSRDVRSEAQIWHVFSHRRHTCICNESTWKTTEQLPMADVKQADTKCRCPNNFSKNMHKKCKDGDFVGMFASKVVPVWESCCRMHVWPPQIERV